MTHPLPEPEPADDVPDPFPISPKGLALLGLLRAGVSLHRIIAIGCYRQAWTPQEARWAKRHYIDNQPDDGQFIPPGFAPTPDWVSTVPRVQITPRQAAVLEAMCRGLNLAEVALELDLTRNTISQHIRRVVVALGAKDAEHAVALATRGRVRVYVVDRSATTRRAA